MSRHRLHVRVLLLALAMLFSSAVFTPAYASQASKPLQKGDSSVKGVGKAQTINVATLRIVQDKLSGKISTHLRLNATGTPPSSSYLGTTYADNIHEPAASGTDAHGNSYTDWDFAYLCGPGAATVSLDYWSNVNTRAIGTHSYYTPTAGVTTWWGDNTNGNQDAAYLMYLATQVQPPSYASPGMMTWNPHTTYVQDLADALNWEGSNHGTQPGSGSNWRNYFYYIQWNPTFSQLQTYVDKDIYNNGIPPVVLLNDAYLPDWANSSAKGAGHYVAIVGYDNNAGTYTYEETCGPYSCGTSGYGRHTVSQQQLLNGIINYGGALIW